VAKGLAATLQLLNQQGGVKALELDSVSGRARVPLCLIIFGIKKDPC